MTDTGFDPFFISNWLDQEWAAKGELKSMLVRPRRGCWDVARDLLRLVIGEALGLISAKRACMTDTLTTFPLSARCVSCVWCVDSRAHCAEPLRLFTVADGRVAMLACVGWWIAEFVHLPDARFQNPVALDAALDIPRGMWAPIIISVSLVEILTFPQMLDSNRRAGDLDFDPLKLDSPKNRLSEVKHGRLAMLAIRTFGGGSPGRVGGGPNGLIRHRALIPARFVQPAVSNSCFVTHVIASSTVAPTLHASPLYLPLPSAVTMVIQQSNNHKPTLSALFSKF